MKLDIRWQVLLAVVGFALVMPLLSFEAQSAGVCSVRVPASGGAVVEGVVGAPQYLNPLLSDNNPVDRELVSLIFDGLVQHDAGEWVPALAETWSVNEDGRIVRFTLRDDIFWHDGEPVTTADVAFTYGLLQDDAFPGSDALKRLWQTVEIRPINDTVIEFELIEPYAAFLEATSRGILPAHRLANITAAALPEADFNQAPIGTGPFVVESNQNWERDGELQLAPFADAWRQETRIDHLVFRFFPDEAMLMDVFTAGEIQAINSVSPVMLPQVAQQPGVRLFSATAPRYTSLIFNVSDSGSVATRSADVRRALAIALDRDALIDQVLNGQGVSLEGPYLPSSWAYNPALLTAFDYDPATSMAILDGAGWTSAEGEAVRQREGVALTLRLLVWETPTNRALAEALADQWTAVGAAPQISRFSAWGDFQRELMARNFDVALVGVTPAHDPDLYDFWSQEAIVRGQNYAGWNHRRASEALESGRQVWSISERKPFYETFLRLFNEDLPALTLFQHVYTYAMQNAVQEVAIGQIERPRDRYETLPGWFIQYRDVPVACPDGVTPTPTPESS